MKIMISQPMNGKTNNEIKEERQDLIKQLEKEGHHVIDSIITDKSPNNENEALYYLYKSIEIMSKVDGVVFMNGWENARGCKIEHEIALKYKLFIKEL